mgnify:FL=1
MKNDLNLNQIDELGMLLAQISDLQKKADKIKDGIKDVASAGGAKVVEGSLFKATYIESNRSSVNWLNIIGNKLGVEFGEKEKAEESWKKVALKLGYEAKELPTAIAEHTSTTAVFSVKVTSR